MTEARFPAEPASGKLRLCHVPHPPAPHRVTRVLYSFLLHRPLLKKQRTFFSLCLLYKRNSSLYLPRAAMRSQPCKLMFAQPGTPKALYNYHLAFLFPPSISFSTPLLLLRFLSDDFVEDWVPVRSHPGFEHAAWG